jgi:acetyl esterase/lipase
MASIEYRLSGDALFPAQLFDVRSAVRHLRTHAAEYGIASVIGLWGSSSGGHLAALAGVTVRSQSPRVPR